MTTTMVAAPAAGMPEGKNGPEAMVLTIEKLYNEQRLARELAMMFIIDSGMGEAFKSYKQANGHRYTKHRYNLKAEAKAELRKGGLR